MAPTRLSTLPPSLLTRGSEVRFGPGDVIFTGGSEAVGLFIILEGHVRIMRGRGGRAHVIHEEGEGGTLGDVPLFEGSRYPATAVATVRTRCLLLTREDVRAAMHDDPDVAMLLLGRMAARVRLLVDQLDRRTGQGTLERLARLVLKRAEEKGAEEKGAASNRYFSLGATQHEIAEGIGTVRELVVRGLKELRDLGIIDSDGRGRYTVKDAAALREIAERDKSFRSRSD